ncbi:sensor histidine kinase [Candidatus Poribacteria bacterium]|nr:sensor histidine kinase [Candidatus Poribacteria bacterium]
MKTGSSIFILSLVMGLFAWLIDAGADYFIFYRGSFFQLLLWGVPHHELYIRSFILLLFGGFGIIASNLLSARIRAEDALRESRDKLEERVEERTASLSAANTLLEREMTQRKRMENELRESEKRLRLLSGHLLTAQERERRRIALELHDDLGQITTLLKLELRAVENKLCEERQSVKTDIEAAQKCANQIIESLRRLSHDLTPSTLEDLGLVCAIRSLVEDFAAHCNIDVLLDIDEVDNLFARKSHLIVYRIFQEALSNIGKHAQASRVSIRACRDCGGSLFFVEDNGKGFDVQKVKAVYAGDKGLGLEAMDERARMLGASLKISSEPGKGTKIALAVPA